jgi:hypothetical protein
MSITPHQIADELSGLVNSPHFVSLAHESVKRWEDAQFNKAIVVEGIFQFMENHPTADIGSPGPLVHFAESLPYLAYRKLLLESLARKPTGHSVGMLNAVINGAKTEAERENLLKLMRIASRHHLASDEARSEALHFLEYQA